MTEVKSALDAWWALSSVFSGGVLGLFLLGYFSKNVQQTEAAIGVVIGILVIAWMSLTPVFITEGPWLSFRNPMHANLTIVIGTLVIFLTGFLLSKVFNRSSH